MLDALKKKALKYVFDRYMKWRLHELLAPTYAVLLDYPISVQPRYGYGKPPHAQLSAIFDQNLQRYESFLSGLNEYASSIADLRKNQKSANFDNEYFSGLDAIALYGLIARQNPRTFLEIGSGFSTHFARAAITDRALQTRIVSCDPRPRTDVEQICDKLIRQPFEQLDLSILDELESGDVFFMDSSHRCFTNSDVTVAFLEVIPRLKSGIYVHFHDILLPLDYPPSWSQRHYSEQYLLASYILGGAANMEIVLPVAHVSTNQHLCGLLHPIWRSPGMAEVESYSRRLYKGHLGFSFWMKTK